MNLKKIAVFILLFSVLAVFCSCDNDANVREVISAISASCPNAPAGKVYFSDAELGEDEYISDQLISALFGNGTYPSEFETIESYALRISSFTTPCEYAVFKAKTIDDTAEIAAMCRKRIDAVQTLVNRGGKDEEKTVAESATVFITGRFVLLAMTEDNETVIDAAKGVLH